MRRSDLRALAVGVLAGAALTAAVVAVLGAVSRPPPFATTGATLPTPVVLPTPTPRPSLPLVLQPDGLGLVTFGDDARPVLEALTSLLGTPDVDERWTCPDPAASIRLLQWADLSVVLFDDVLRGYLDGIHYPPDRGPPLGLSTAEGLAIGASLDELEALYGDRLELLGTTKQEDRSVSDYRIGDAGIGVLVETTGDGSQVITIRAGSHCFDDAP